MIYRIKIGKLDLALSEQDFDHLGDAIVLIEMSHLKEATVGNVTITEMGDKANG